MLSTDGQTDRQVQTNIPPNHFVVQGGIKTLMHHHPSPISSRTSMPHPCFNSLPPLPPLDGYSLTILYHRKNSRKKKIVEKNVVEKNLCEKIFFEEKKVSKKILSKFFFRNKLLQFFFVWKKNCVKTNFLQKKNNSRKKFKKFQIFFEKKNCRKKNCWKKFSLLKKNWFGNINHSDAQQSETVGQSMPHFSQRDAVRWAMWNGLGDLSQSRGHLNWETRALMNCFTQSQTGHGRE